MPNEIYEHFAVLDEFERGWGSKTFIVRGYETKEAAEKEVTRVNSRNTSARAPEYYIQASYSDDWNYNKHKELVRGQEYE